MEQYDFDVYLLCPVRKASDEEKIFLEQYKKKLENKGLKVHYPANDTVQEDKTGGYRICKDHCDEIARSKTVHVYWNGNSTGSYVDLGTALSEHHRRGLDIILADRKKVKVIVNEQEQKGITKSYEKVLLRLDDLANSSTKV